MRHPHGNFFNDARAHINPMSGGVDLRLGMLLPGDKIQDMTLSHMGTPRGPEIGAFHQQLQYSEAQLLLDALLEAGVKPSSVITEEKSETYSAGKVEAMKEHLADLRRLAFGEQPAPEQVFIEVERSPDTPRTRADTI